MTHEPCVFRAVPVFGLARSLVCCTARVYIYTITMRDVFVIREHLHSSSIRAALCRPAAPLQRASGCRQAANWQREGEHTRMLVKLGARG